MVSKVVECDVLVVGGGITGCATSYHLSRTGQRVVLAEQRDINTQASGRNAGSLHGQIQFEPYRTRGKQWALDFLPALRMLVDSLTMWRELAAELGTDLEVSTKGGLLVAETDEQAAQVAEKVAFEAAHGFPAELVSGAELRRLAPYLSPRMIAAQYCPLEGKTNPLLAAPAFARAARRQGATVLTNTEVRSISGTRGAFRVATTGPAISCDKIVLTANARLPEFGAALGTPLPITDEPVQVHATEALAPVIPHLVYYAGGRLTLKQARTGTLLIGGGWPAAVDPETGHPTVSTQSMRSNLHVALHLAPWMADVQVIRAWAGVGNATPDLRPLVGESATPGVFIGMFPHMGLTAGPVMGQLLAALVQGKNPQRDLTAFALDRFTSVPSG